MVTPHLDTEVGRDRFLSAQAWWTSEHAANRLYRRLSHATQTVHGSADWSSIRRGFGPGGLHRSANRAHAGKPMH